MTTHDGTRIIFIVIYFLHTYIGESSIRRLLDGDDGRLNSFSQLFRGDETVNSLIKPKAMSTKFEDIKDDREVIVEMIKEYNTCSGGKWNFLW